MINIKNLDPSKIQINERIINTISGYSKESNGNKYLTLGPTNENKDTLKNIKKLWNKIKNITRSIINNSDNYDEKFINTEFNSNHDSTLKKTLELNNMVIVLKSVFHEGSKHYLHVS